jgi:hypothetical protein
MSDGNLLDGEYVLTDGAAWFRVKNFSIRIQSTDEGVVVDLYPYLQEMEEPVASCWAFDSEVEPEDNDSELSPFNTINS